MRCTYSCSSGLFRSRQLAIALGAFTLPLLFGHGLLSKPAPNPEPIAKPKPAQVARPLDPRVEKLVRYFARLHCPVLPLAPEFVQAADENRLDWRLLPGISVIESGGGKAYKNNNIFGWDNGLHVFSSVRSGIREVASRLGKSPLYRNRDLVGKLKVYNHDEAYARNVVGVMNQISPVVTPNLDQPL
jgi:hypothetical protein